MLNPDRIFTIIFYTFFFLLFLISAEECELQRSENIRLEETLYSSWGRFSSNRSSNYRDSTVLGKMYVYVRRYYRWYSCTKTLILYLKCPSSLYFMHVNRLSCVQIMNFNYFKLRFLFCLDFAITKIGKKTVGLIIYFFSVITKSAWNIVRYVWGWHNNRGVDVVVPYHQARYPLLFFPASDNWYSFRMTIIICIMYSVLFFLNCFHCQHAGCSWYNVFRFSAFKGQLWPHFVILLRLQGKF